MDIGADKTNKLHSLLLSGHVNKLDKKQLLQTTDSLGVSILASGYIKRYLIKNDGNIGVQIIYGPGDVFPLTNVFSAFFNQPLYRGREIFYYEAMVDSEIHTIHSQELLRAVKSDKELYARLLQEAGKHLESCVHSLENIALRSAYERVAHQLAYFATRFGEQTSQGTKLVIPLTHQDIADILSVTRETVSNSITKLRKNGYIKTKKHIVVPSVENLEKAAYGQE